MLVGLGKPQTTASWGENGFHAAGAAIATAAKSYKLKTIDVDVSHLADAGPGCLTSLVSASITGLYEGNVRYRSKPEPKAQLTSLQLLVGPHGQSAAVEAAAKGVALAQGTLMARYLVEAPANVCTPRHLAAAAAHIQAINPDRFKLKVLEEVDCKKLGMGLFLGVAQGSDEPLRFIHLTYTPEGPVTQKVALVGKGLTFDSGGYNLKVQGGIETMKCDMGGAGAILGAARTLAQLQPAGVEVHFITAACENMVSGRATKPSDIHTAASGKTVEVNDTDAEGRLTLADALWYAQTQAGAQTVVDIATLTGAAGIALGQDTAALFANTDSLAAALDDAGKQTGEKFWRLPLNPDLKCKLESPIADLKNYAGRWGGAITAALFLQEFINEGTQWAHLDVAGPAWNDAASLPTGFGAATLAYWVDSLAGQVAAQ
jgi:leucyl aminopeptidase